MKPSSIAGLKGIGYEEALITLCESHVETVMPRRKDRSITRATVT
jgi:hypothetical protein